jgi:hypothetical protein
MKKRYRNRQNMMEVFMAFAVPQLFLGLMFKRLTFGEKLLFILAVSLRLFFEAVGLRRSGRVAGGWRGRMRVEYKKAPDRPREVRYAARSGAGVTSLGGNPSQNE